jgi:large subunit ribosomal protein L10
MKKAGTFHPSSFILHPSEGGIMSKQIKQMEMAALGQTFREVRDLVVLSSSGVNAQADNQMRLALRKKNIRLQIVKNSLARRVFDELGMRVTNPAYWTGPTLLAWGGTSLAELSRELDTLIRKNDKFKVKGAVSDGQEVTFKQALTMPTQAEAVGRVVSLALSPATRLVSQILAPAARVAGQIKTLREKPAAPEGAPAEGQAAPPA